MKAITLRHNLVKLFIGSLIGCTVGVCICTLLLHDDTSKKPIEELVSVPSLVQNNQMEFSLLGGNGHASTASIRRNVFGIVQDMSGDEIADLLLRTQTNGESKNLLIVQGHLLEALALTDPKLSIETVWEFPPPQRKRMFDIVVSIWSTLDEDTTIELIADLPEFWRRVAIRSFLLHRSDGEEIKIAEHVHSGASLEVINELELRYQVGQLRATPDRAIEQVLQSDVSDFSKVQLVSGLARRWFNNEGRDSIGLMLNIFSDALSDEPSILVPLVDVVSSLDSSESWQYFLSRPSQERRSLVHGVAGALIKKDPLRTIDWIDALDDDQLLPAERRQFYYAWTRQSPDMVHHHLDRIPTEFRADVIALAVPKLVASSKPEVVLEQLESFARQGEHIKKAQKALLIAWSNSDPAAALTWYLDRTELISGLYLDHYLSTALERLAVLDPEQAMEIAMSQPSNRNLDREVILSLLRFGNIDDGLAFLPQVQKTSITPEFYAEVGRVLVEVKRPAAAIGLAAKLPEADRERYFVRLITRWMSTDIDSLLRELGNIPNEMTRSRLAENLLAFEGDYSPSLTDSEREIIGSYILDD